jgi:TonB family protein
MVRVTMASPTIRFAVPTPGNIIVPENLAVAPPGDSAPAAPAREKTAAPGLLGNTGHGGDRPQPEYPKMAQDLGQQGTVVLLLTADEAGIVISAEVEQSSGSSILDHAAAEFVKRHWTVAPGARGRKFRAPIRYQLN